MSDLVSYDYYLNTRPSGRFPAYCKPATRYLASFELSAQFKSQRRLAAITTVEFNSNVCQQRIRSPVTGSPRD